MSSEGLRAPRQIRVVFLGVMLLLAATLGWLGWRLLQQDQQLLGQRLAERREIAADLTVAGLEKRLSSVEHDLSQVLVAGEAPKMPAEADAVLVKFLPTGIRVWPQHRLVYYPELPEAPEAPATLFLATDELEFKKTDYSGAIAALREPANSTDPKVRAAALVRIARNCLKNGQVQESLKTYEQLASLGPVPVGGMPAGLVAKAGALAAFEQQKDQAALTRTALALDRDLQSGHWPITAATYHYLAELAGRWARDTEVNPAPRVALAEGVEWLWDRWRATRDRTTSAGGRTSFDTPSGPVLLVWRFSGNTMAGFAAGADYLANQWLANMKPLLDSQGVRLALTTPDGRPVLGSAPGADAHPSIRLSSATQLPWTVQVFNTSDSQGAFRSRRGLLIAGMCVLLALILTGGWFVGRSVERELAVARLQSDFVSAVSHEFRTPLTTLCQLSELLRRGRVASEQDRQQYYELLHKESDGLRRLVEGLLNFGRLQAGQMPYRFEKLDAAALVRRSVAEFEQGQQAPKHRFEVETAAEPAAVHADPEALRCVFWNLFENAVKYSPDCDTVWVELARNGRHIEIAVRDRGVGIPPSEQRRIFERFVRGSAARESNVRGTGIGLAMARQIVRAHGGDITVESEPGKGSTFRVLLPVSTERKFTTDEHG